MSSTLLLLAGGVELPAETGDTILAAMKRADRNIHTICGGRGICGTCRVAIDEAWLPLLTPPTKGETRLLRVLKAGAANHRLACQTVLDARHHGLEFTPDTPPGGSLSATESRS